MKNDYTHPRVGPIVNYVFRKEVQVTLPGTDGYIVLTMNEAVEMYRQLHRVLDHAGLLDTQVSKAENTWGNTEFPS